MTGLLEIQPNPTVASVASSGGFVEDVTFGFTTIDRRHAAFEAVRTIRRHFPENRIILIDQNLPDEDAVSFYEEHSASAQFVEYDCGLSAARNQMFSSCDSRFFFMLDDDVVEIIASEIKASYNTLSETSDVLVIGGRSGKISTMPDGQQDKQINPPFNNSIFCKSSAQLVLLFNPSLYDGIGPPRYDNDKRYRLAEVAENFSIFNVEKYRKLGLRWDEDLKIGVEHLDFYFNTQCALSSGDDAKMLLNPNMVAYDVDALTEQSMAAYRKKRFRQNFRNLYSRKWNAAAEIHLGNWTNVFWPDGHKTIRPTEIARFFESQKSHYERSGIDLRERFEDYEVGPRRLTFIATTIDRFDAIQALVISIRARFDQSVDIVIGLQTSNPPEGFDVFATHFDVRTMQMEDDIGLSAARNLLVQEVNTDYFVLCDDDFVVDDAFVLGNAIHTLGNEPEVAGVGGCYRDIIYSQDMRLDCRTTRHFTFHAAYEPLTGTLIRVPFYHLPFSECFDMERGVNDVDVLQNLAVFRTSNFGKDVLHWDDHMKISGEHMDFYVKNLLVDKKTFVFDPSLSVLHNRVQNGAYRAKRMRTDGIELFHEKWNIRHEVYSELGVRSPCRNEMTWRAIRND